MSSVLCDFFFSLSSIDIIYTQTNTGGYIRKAACSYRTFLTEIFSRTVLYPRPGGAPVSYTGKEDRFIVYHRILSNMVSILLLELNLYVHLRTFRER